MPSTGLAVISITFSMVLGMACQQGKPEDQQTNVETSMTDTVTQGPKPIAEPLVTHMYSADPSAHVFEDKVYIYPSHDIETEAPQNDAGDHFDMRDYHVLSMNSVPGEVTDHGVALQLKDIPWASKQLWAPDAAFRNGTYYLYFPAKDKTDAFRIGVATSPSPTGPFSAQPEPIAGSYSIDPTVFKDADGKHYMYFGGIWGGQLQRWATGKFDPNGSKTDLQKDHSPAIGPRVVKMKEDMLGFAEAAKEVRILDQGGNPILGGDHDRRFFEAAWMHRYNGKYYFSYSTGDTHFICYATGDNPYGPFTWQGIILKPVIGWTNHHSIVEFKGKWYLFYHDSVLSGGQTHLRNVRVTELRHRPDGTIETIDPYTE